MNKGTKNKSYVIALVLTALAIALWGFAHRLYATLVPALGPVFSLPPNQASLARPAIAIGYLVMALPTAFISRNLGYKISMLFGLGLFAVGMFLVYPAILQHSLVFFLVSATVVGSGLAVLEIIAIPLIIFVGSPATAIQRATLAAALSPVGGVVALYLGPVILAQSANDPGFANSMVALFSAVGVTSIALAFVMELTPFPAIARERVAATDHTLASFTPPLRLKRFRIAVAACLLCLFAQIIFAGFAPPYSRFKMPALTPSAAEHVLIWAYLSLAVGRLFGALLMRWMAPMRLLVVFAAISAIASLVSAATSGPAAIIAMLAACFFMSVVFPAIFTDTLLRLGAMAKSATAVMMLIVYSGTSLLSLLTLVCVPKILPGIMIVPALCFSGVAILSVVLQRPETSRPSANK